MRYKYILLVFSIVFITAHGCGQDAPVVEKPTSDKETSIKLFPNLVVDSFIWDIAQNELEISMDAQAAFNRWIVIKATEGMTAEPFAVPKIEQTVQAEVVKNADYIYSIAIRWLFMDQTTDKADKYLQKVTEMIHEWAIVNVPTNHTPVESILTPVYEAYSIIRNHIGENERQEIDNWIKMRATFYKNLRLTGNLLENNWNTIRINLLFDFAQILDDQKLYDNAVGKFKSHIELNILESGKTHDFINRDALSYHAYNMLFYARILKAIAMYKGEEEAVKFCQMKNGKGSSIESCVKFWEPYIIDPANHIHLEFVNTEWAPDKNSNAYNKPYNPAGTLYVLDELRFIEKKCTDYIEAVSSANRYGRTFKYWINSVEKTHN